MGMAECELFKVVFGILQKKAYYKMLKEVFGKPRQLQVEFGRPTLENEVKSEV